MLMASLARALKRPNSIQADFMPEICVTYDREGQSCLAVVRAPQVPWRLRFRDYDELRAEMDAFDKPWLLRAELDDPYPEDEQELDAWLGRIAEANSMLPDPKPPTDLRAPDDLQVPMV